jgi:hypothetical protein
VGGGVEAWLEEAGSCPELQVITAKYHREAITRHGTGGGGGGSGPFLSRGERFLSRPVILRGGGVLSFSGGESSYPVIPCCALFCYYEGVLSFPDQGKGSYSFLGAGIMSLLDLKRGGGGLLSSS